MEVHAITTQKELLTPYDPGERIRPVLVGPIVLTW